MEDDRTTIPELDQRLPRHTRAAWSRHFDIEWSYGHARGLDPAFVAEISDKLVHWRRAIETEWFDAPFTA